MPDSRTFSPAACMKRGLARASALLAGLACLPAIAQTSIESTNDWKFELVPYVWLTGVRADVKFGPLPTNTLHVRSTTLLQALDFAASGTLEARHGDWGGLFDAQYIRLGVSDSYAAGLLGGYNVRMVQHLYTLAGFYRLVNTPSVEIDLLGGARYASAGTTVNIFPSPLGNGSLSQDSVGWWNGIFGVRALLPINDTWSLMGYIDGGSGNGSTSWQGIAGASYQYSPSTSFKFGYRYLSLDRKESKEGLMRKMALGGIYLGAGFKF